MTPGETCPRCRGEKTVRCVCCHETGKVDLFAVALLCEECGGLGHRVCSYCEGRGSVPLVEGSVPAYQGALREPA